MERVTTFSNGTRVVENFRNAQEIAEGYIPKTKRVYLPESSPLKAAGIDHFCTKTMKSGSKTLSLCDKEGYVLSKTGLASEIKQIIKAIKRYGLKLR